MFYCLHRVSLPSVQVSPKLTSPIYRITRNALPSPAKFYQVGMKDQVWGRGLRMFAPVHFA
ncbi:MAG: hypothetical protein EAZ24_05435 [Burkholderiales bacterium]|nr:MAG: hypothetical protein EAZ24_05435 [Burkholderiales bacterium]